MNESGGIFTDFIIFSSISILNQELKEENPEKYNDGWRYVDFKARGLRYVGDHTDDTTHRIKLVPLNEDGKIIVTLRPFSELVIRSPLQG